MRSSGILLPISSLPSKYGIGTMGKEAYKFVDFLVEAGQTYWQILPVCPTSFGDSPYQSFSTFAGNPYFIDLDMLQKDGLLKKSEYQNLDYESTDDRINYGVMYNRRYSVLRKAFERFDIDNEEFVDFCNDNEWLEEYALFMSLKNSYNGGSFDVWDKKYIQKDCKAMNEFERTHLDDINFWMFVQYEFFKQWKELKAYANKKGIKIIGDCPIYVALDSADVFFNPKLFQLDENLKPKKVAGCPPDAFSDDGQLWGNPLYDWDYHKETGYKWWIRRVEALSKIYDVIRIDHFIGFESYYAIDYGMKDGKVGKRFKGPGIELFDKIKEKLGDVNIIAEDLGILTENVKALLKQVGYPGMKVLMFAFDDMDPENIYLPHNMVKNCISYIGTHDNEPVMAYKEKVSKKVLNYIYEYTGIDKEKEFNWEMIKLLESTVSDICIIQAQDILGLGMESRMNYPSKLGVNWQWRMTEGALTKEHAKKLKKLAKLYGRFKEEPKKKEK